MAKTEGQGDGTGSHGVDVDQRLVDFAEDLGRILGTAQRKADEWLSQRKQISEQLETIRNTASQLLAQLGEHVAEAAAAVRRGRPGRPAGSGKAKKAGAAAKSAVRRGAKKRRAVSEETKAKMRAAWEKRRAAKE